MTLLELLVKELPKRGGWLDAYQCAQDKNGEICFYSQGVLRYSDHFNGWVIPKGSEAEHDSTNRVMLSTLADEYSQTVIHRKQYEAALAASQKVEWDGTGLPPVGSHCEVNSEDFEGDWVTIKVVYVHAGEVIGIVQSENEYLHDRMEKFSPGYNAAQFRPIRSEADKKRYAAANAMCNVQEFPAGEITPEDVAMGNGKLWVDVYDAIAAGKIPGVRIE